MVQPIDYMSALPQVDLGQSLLSGIQAGAAIRKVRQEDADREIALKQQEQFRTDLQDAFTQPNAQKFAALTAKYPSMHEAFKQSWDTLNEDQKNAEFTAGTQVYNALGNGNIEAANSVLDQHITAMRNSGQDTTDLEGIKAQIARDPTRAQAYIGMTLASTDGPRWKGVADAEAQAQKTPIELRKAGAEATKAELEAADTPQRLALTNGQSQANIDNLRSTISERSRRIGLDEKKYNNEVEAKAYELRQKGTTLDADQRKELNTAVANAVGAKGAAANMLDLAGRLEKEGGGYGAFSTAGEWLKKATGNQTVMSDMRKEYIRMRNSEAIKMLPPGVATDKDVAMALEGFPDPSADARTIASFLRGMAKINNAAAVSENARSEWINEVGHAGKTRRDIVIDGVNVPAGTTFSDFSSQYIPRKLEQRGAEQAQQNIGQRSYMVHSKGKQ